MASEPAEPTTRQDMVDKVADAICDAYEVYAPVPGVLRSEAPNIARALADLGLLADPAQTTEQHAERLDRALWLWAEEKWRREQLLAQREQWWESVAKQRGEVEVNRDALSLLLRGMARKLVAYRKWALKAHRDQDWTLNRVRAALGTPDGRAVSVHAAEVRAERDERQARIDAALAKVNGWIAKRSIDQYAYLLTDELLQLRAALVGDQPPAKHCQYQVLPGTEPEENGLCIQPATEGEFCGTHAARLSGVALRAVEEADDAAEPHHSPPPDPASLTEGEA